ncbi:MAG TPA: glycosyltransferase family 2 protein [Roseiflexaceae bacterium]|nr:glycosyltransferase family 2 protein [Roseiflexaceae bacterium]HMP39530.1 glycosyltransferase family 2 protein [Roseiflexaceae bacterium]
MTVAGIAARPVTLTALVPVYNEVDTLEEIVSRLEQNELVRQIVVVDDYSNDGTRDVIERLTAAGRIVSALHDRNRGKGAGLRSGLALASEPYVVFQDADLEYHPREFHAMADIVRTHGARVVYGSRFMGAKRTGMLWTHYLGNRGLTLFFNVVFGCWITDMETCYKLFDTELLRSVGIDNDRFDVDPELTAKMVRLGLRIHEVPVTYEGRPYLAGKKIRPRDALSAAETVLRYRRWQVPAAAMALLAATGMKRNSRI